MKKNQPNVIILFLFVVICFLSCDYEEVKIPDKGRFIHQIPNNNGTVTQKEYKDGKLKSVFTIKDKKKVGEGFVYYPNGNVHTKYVYKNGLLNGEAIWNYQNGNKYDITIFENGKKNGMRRTFFENGTLRSKQLYENDKPMLGLKEYTTSGVLINQPEIIFKRIDKLVYENKYILQYSLSDKSSKVDFFQVFKDENGNDIILKNDSKNGIGEIFFIAFPGGVITEDITIRAEKTTKYKNKLVLEKSIRIGVVNR